MSFDEILDKLLVPRENGTPALEHIAAWLQSAGRATGADVTVHEFACYPYVHWIGGAVALLLGLAFAAAVWRGRFAWAVGASLALPLYLALELEYHVPLLSRFFPVRAQNVLLSFPVTGATQTVILGAHYDTKTDLLDHYQRAPLQFLIAPVALLTIAIAISGWRRAGQGAGLRGIRAGAALVGLYYAAFALALSGGALLPARSPGALDDGASVAALLKVAEALGDNEISLGRTNVVVALFAGEEVAVQGSHAYVRDTRPGREGTTYFINAEGLGAGNELRYFTSDRFALRRYDASGLLARTLDRASRLSLGHGLAPDPRPVITDARSFMAAGIPSVCLTSGRGTATELRGLHSPRDARDRVDLPSLQGAVKFYLAALGEIDRG